MPTVRQNKSGQENRSNAIKSNNKVVNAPTAQAKKTKTTEPKISNVPSKDGAIRVRHREYLFDLVGTTTSFHNRVLPINPGLSFPWLSQLASLYESYLFNKLEFEYCSSAATSFGGSIMLAIDFDAGDPAPLSKVDLMANVNAVRTAVWEGVAYQASNADLKKFGTQRFVRTGNLQANQDIKTYDVGNFNIATQGVSNATLGEVYVSYDVTLHTPQPSSFLTDNAAKISDIVDIASQNLFGSRFTLQGSLPLRWHSPDSIYMDRAGDYIINFDYVATGTDDTDTLVVSFPTSTDGSVNYLGQNGTADTSVTPNHFYQFVLVRVNRPGAILEVNDVTFGSVTSGVVRFAPYPYSIA